MKKAKKNPPPKSLAEEERLAKRKRNSQIIRGESKTSDNPLESIFGLPRLETPRCKCGAAVGLACFDDRHWCPNCLWKEIRKLRATIKQLRKGAKP